MMTIATASGNAADISAPQFVLTLTHPYRFLGKTWMTVRLSLKVKYGSDMFMQTLTADTIGLCCSRLKYF